VSSSCRSFCFSLSLVNADVGSYKTKCTNPWCVEGIQRGSTSALTQSQLGECQKEQFFVFFCFPKLCWEFRVLLFFCLHIQTKGSMCPSGMSAEVTVNDSARSKHPKTTHTHTRKKPKQKNHTKKLWLCCLWCFVVYVCVCGVPKPVLKNVAECSQHGMTWDRPKSWKNGWKGRKKERRRRKRRRRHLIFWSLSLSLSLSSWHHFFLSVFETSYQMPIFTNCAFEMQKKTNENK